MQNCNTIIHVKQNYQQIDEICHLQEINVTLTDLEELTQIVYG
jgi:hypothetical protein